MRILRYILIFAALLYSFECVAATTYRAQLRLATHKTKKYNLKNADPYIIWRATMFTPRFRRAFGRKHVKIEHMEPLEASRWMAEAEKTQAECWEFFISMYNPRKYSGFSMDVDSFWKIRLTGEDEEVAPLSIERLPKTPYYEVMFPYVDRWTRIYRVTFPKIKLGKVVKLRMYSILGDSIMSWKMSNTK